MNKSFLYIVLAATGWGITGVFITALSNYGFSTTFLGAVRPTFSALFVGIWLLITNRSLFRIKIKDIWVFAGTGIFSFTFFTYCYYVSIIHNGLAVAAVLLYTAPIFVAVMSTIFFKTSFTKYTSIALLLSFSGCALVSEIFSSSQRISSIGILVGLGSGIGYALYSIFGEVAIKKGYKSETIAFYTFAFAAIATSMLALYNGIPKNINFEKVGIWLLLFALVTGAGPYILYTKGLENTEPSKAAISATFEPLVATVLGIVVLKEIPTLSKTVGILLILVSLFVAGKKKES